jgi:hypothetical protein
LAIYYCSQYTSLLGNNGGVQVEYWSVLGPLDSLNSS